MRAMTEPPEIKFLVRNADKETISDFESLPFDIYDESTFGNISVGKMAYYLFKDAIENGFVSDNEIKLLMDKEYSHNLFNLTHYPVLADDVNTHRGKSVVKRYRKTAILYGEEKLYVTTH